MTEVSEAQEIVKTREAERDLGGAQIPPANQEQAQVSAQPAAEKKSGWFSSLFRREKQTPQSNTPTLPESTPLKTPAAINTNGEAIHGIGDYVSEKELSELEQGGETKEPPSGSEPYRTPDGEFGLKVHSDKVPDAVGTDVVSNPKYNANTAPENVTPINEHVAGQVPPPDGRPTS